MNQNKQIPEYDKTIKIKREFIDKNSKKKKKG